VAQSPLEYVVAHWSKLFENFNTSSGQFYLAVGAALKRREIPDAPRYRVHWSEGGVLSPNREYLRIEGSGFACDICAAEFGTGFFFSWWLTRKPAQFVLFFLALYLGISWGISKFLATIIWKAFESAPITFDATMIMLRLLLMNPITIAVVSLLLGMALVGVLERGGLRGPGEALKTVPVVGWLYEKWFSPVTFYRLDTAAMFRATVHAAVLEVLDNLTTQKGIKALAPEERKPILRGMS
jgi:hypothetical protein